MQERGQDKFYTFTRMHGETVSVAVYNTVFTKVTSLKVECSSRTTQKVKHVALI